VKSFLYGAVLTASVLAGVTPAGAQQLGAPGNFGQPPANPFGNPAISPFLNLNRGGNPAINYFGIVQPQLQTSQSLQQLQQGQMSLEQNAMYGQTGTGAFGSMTGHPAVFMNTLHYYPPNVFGVAQRR
jgi:hypothetical protein